MLSLHTSSHTSHTSHTISHHTSWTISQRYDTLDSIPLPGQLRCRRNLHIFWTSISNTSPMFNKKGTLFSLCYRSFSFTINIYHRVFTLLPLHVQLLQILSTVKLRGWILHSYNFSLCLLNFEYHQLWDVLQDILERHFVSAMEKS